MNRHGTPYFIAAFLLQRSSQICIGFCYIAGYSCACSTAALRTITMRVSFIPFLPSLKSSCFAQLMRTGKEQSLAYISASTSSVSRSFMPTDVRYFQILLTTLSNDWLLLSFCIDPRRQSDAHCFPAASRGASSRPSGANQEAIFSLPPCRCPSHS